MKKILLLIFWAATIVLCSFALPNDQSVISDVIPKEYVEIMEQQKEPLAAYQTLYSTFNQDDKGRYVYPDEYAGEWLDGNKLVIALTDVSKEKLDKYIDILKHYNCVKFVKAKYSITFLYKLADEVFETLNDMNITKYGVDVENNKLTFGYIGDVNNFKKEITEIFPDYVSIISVYSSNLCKLTSDLVDGVEISHTLLDKTCTLGMCGTTPSTGNNAIVTCGHNVSSASVFQYNGSTIGSVYATLCGNGNYGDFTVVKITSSDTMTNLVKGSGGTNLGISGYANSIPVNTVYVRYGKAS